MYDRLRKGFQRLLEVIVIILMSALTIVVLVAVAYRKGGASLSWYDEIASILLAWLTFARAAGIFCSSPVVVLSINVISD